MNKAIIGSGVALVAVLALAGCSTGTKTVAPDSTDSGTHAQQAPLITNDWEDELRAGVRYGFGTGADAKDACDGLASMGLDTPAEFADFLEGMPSDMMDDALGSVGGMDGAVDSLPEGVTIRDVFVASGDEIMNICANA